MVETEEKKKGQPDADHSPQLEDIQTCIYIRIQLNPDAIDHLKRGGHQQRAINYAVGILYPQIG
jgi:hypothetical protein